MATPIIGDFTVFCKTATVVYGDTSATRLFDLPAHAHVVDIIVDVTTAFGGNKLLDIGKFGDTDYFAANVDVQNANARATVNVLHGGADLGERLTEVQIEVDATTSGEATITFCYFCYDRSHLH